MLSAEKNLNDDEPPLESRVKASSKKADLSSEVDSKSSKEAPVEKKDTKKADYPLQQPYFPPHKSFVPAKVKPADEVLIASLNEPDPADYFINIIKSSARLETSNLLTISAYQS